MLTDYIVYGRAPGETRFKVVQRRLNGMVDTGKLGNRVYLTIRWDSGTDHALQLVAQIAAMEAANPGWEFDLRVMD